MNCWVGCVIVSFVNIVLCFELVVGGLFYVLFCFVVFVLLLVVGVDWCGFLGY